MSPLLKFPFFYLTEVIRGAANVAWDVLTPGSRVNPVLLRVPLFLDSPRQRLLLANLITMTPGTLAVDEVEEGAARLLLVHSLYGGAEPEAALNEIQERYQKVVARLPI